MITISGMISISLIDRIDTNECRACSNVSQNKTQDLQKQTASIKRALHGSALILPEGAAVRASIVGTTTGCLIMMTAWRRPTI